MSPRKKSLRLIGYIRVSRVAGREGDSFISPITQRERIERYAATHDHHIIDVIEELDAPGTKYEREGFQTALARVEAREADGVIVARLDRFARSLPDALRAIQRLEEAGGHLIVEDLGIDTTTPSGRLVRNVMLALAEWQLGVIRDNWSTARAHAVERGVHISRTPIYGYRRGADGRLEPDPATAPVVKELFRRRAAGENWSSLARWLNADHPKNGANWIHPSVAALIRSRTYIGEARHGEYVNPSAHPSLVTRPEWEAANAARSTATGRRDDLEPALLAGIIRCAGCRYVMPRSAARKVGKARYGCAGHHALGDCQNRTRISIAVIEPYIEGQFLDWAGRQHIAATGTRDEGSLGDATKALEAAEAELEVYRDETVIGLIGKDAYQAGLAKRASDVENARRELLAIQSTIGELDVTRDMLDEWPSLPVSVKRTILASAIDAVMVKPASSGGLEDRVRILWRGEAPEDLPRRGRPQPIVPFRF